VLPRQQCDGIRNYIVNLIIKLSSDETTLQKERLFLKKLNITLVQVRALSFRFCVTTDIPFNLPVLADPEAGMATQLGNLHP
jgi:hypothetical protein